jgi:Protein of unknown function (DUF3110)
VRSVFTSTDIKQFKESQDNGAEETVATTLPIHEISESRESRSSTNTMMITATTRKSWFTPVVLAFELICTIVLTTALAVDAFTIITAPPSSTLLSTIITLQSSVTRTSFQRQLSREAKNAHAPVHLRLHISDDDDDDYDDTGDDVHDNHDDLITTPELDWNDLYQRVYGELEMENVNTATTTTNKESRLLPMQKSITGVDDKSLSQVLPTHVHVVTFPLQDGVHTIEHPKGSGNNVILAFESLKACEKFAQTLKDRKQFVSSWDPTVCYLYFWLLFHVTFCFHGIVSLPY